MKKMVVFIITLISTLTFAGITPRGTQVDFSYNGVFTDSDIQTEITKYLGLGYDLDDIISDPTNEYNCHGYAWTMTEGGTDAWPVDPSLTNPHFLTERKEGAGGYQDYYDDGSYNEVESAYATVIKYASDHSAIKDPEAPPADPPSPHYFSKWCCGPLVRHLPNECPYYIESYPPSRYFAKANDIPYEHGSLSAAISGAKSSQAVYIYCAALQGTSTKGNYSYSSSCSTATLAVTDGSKIGSNQALVIYPGVNIVLEPVASIEAANGKEIKYVSSLNATYSTEFKTVGSLSWQTPISLETRTKNQYAAPGEIAYGANVSFSPKIEVKDTVDQKTKGFYGSVFTAVNNAGDNEKVYINTPNAPLGNGNITDLSKITLAAGASISAPVLLKNSSGTLLGYYSNLGDAVNSAQAGDTVSVNSNITLTQDVTTNSAVNVCLGNSSGAITVDLNSYNIKIFNGEIDIALSVDFAPNDIRLKRNTTGSGWTVRACYSSLADAFADALPGDIICLNKKPTYFTGNFFTDRDSIELQISADTLMLGSHHISLPNGSIYIDSSAVLLPGDIQLKDSTGIIHGCYGSFADAVDSARTSDHVYVNSDITLSQDVASNDAVKLHFAENTNIDLNSHKIQVLNGEINTYTSTTFQPKKMEVRKLDGYDRVGVYPDLTSALAVNNTNYRVVCHSSDTLSTSQVIPMDVRVQQVGALTVSEGVTLSFDPDTRLEVFGSMSCKGTSSSAVTLTRNGSTGSWDGIYVGNGTTGGNISMGYTTVRNADKGVYLDLNSNGTIEHTTLKYCDTGLQAQMANSVTIASNSWVQNCNDYGINVHGVNSFTMSWSHSHNYNCIGLKATDGDGIISSSAIRDCYQGIEAASQTLNLGSSCSSYGYNNFQNNRNIALALTSGDYDTEIDCYGDYWYNSGWYIPGGPTVNRSCDLTNPPTSREKETDTIDLTSQVHLAGTGDATEQLALARSLKQQGRYDEAYPVFKALLNSEELTGAQKGRVLHHLYATHERWNYSDIAIKSTDDMGILLSEILTANAPEKGTGEADMYRVAMNLLINYNVRQENINGAIAMCENVIANYPGSLYEEMRLSDLVYFYLRCKGNKTLAESYLAELKNKYPESSFTAEAEKFFEMFTVEVSGDDEAPASRPKAPGSESPEKSNIDTESLLPTEWGLEQNFPNPFNATTEIHYAVPEASRVKIVVINAVGQQVAELVNQNQEIGFHKVLWNANDVPSGLYFIRLFSPAYNKVQKAILLK